MRDPTIRQIRYFIAVANTGQFSKAARELNVSQSALTTAVKQLEAIVGSTLFERTSGGVVLTQEGNIFMDHAHRILSALEEAVRSPARRRDDIRGTIRLAMTYTVAGYYLPPLIERFSRTYTGVDIKLTEAPRGTIEDGLVSGTFDIAVLLTSNIADQEGLAHETMLSSRRRLWLSSRHPLLEYPSVSLAEVSEHPYIMFTADEASNTAQRYWNKTNYRPNTIFRTSSVEAIRSMVAGGMGVTILSDMVYRPWSLEGRRVEVMPVADNIPSMDVGLAWAANIELNQATTAFRDFMHVGRDQV